MRTIMNRLRRHVGVLLVGLLSILACAVANAAMTIQRLSNWMNWSPLIRCTSTPRFLSWAQ